MFIEVCEGIKITHTDATTTLLKFRPGSSFRIREQILAGIKELYAESMIIGWELV